MKKIVILISVVLVLLIAYLVMSKKSMDTGNNEANVISNLFKGKEETAVTKPMETSKGRPAITPAMSRFQGSDPKKVQEVFIDGLKKQVPKGQDVPR